MSDADIAIQLPPGSCDSHMHVFGPPEHYRGAPDRSYDPRERTLTEYATLAEGLGFGRVVFVQPSAYGTDNSCLLDSLRLRQTTARAVVVIGEQHDKSALRAMDEAGVRGARLNLMTPRVTDGRAAQARLEEVARRVAPLGWHLQIYADLEVVEIVAPSLRNIEVPVVFDHMGGATRSIGTNARGFQALLSELADGNCWVKLSGADIVTWESSDFSSATSFAASLIYANENQLVWGSDWPHLVHQSAGIGADAPPAAFRPVDERSLLHYLRQWSGNEETLRRILVENPQRLYGF